MDKLLLRFYRLSLPLLVLLFPFANSDLFYLVIPKLYPARGFLIILVAVSLLALFFQVVKKRSLNFIVAEIRSDSFLKIVLGLFLVRTVSLIMTRNLVASLMLLAFFASMVAMYVILKWVGRRDFNFINRLYYLHLAAVSLVGVYGLLQAVLLIFHYKLPGVLLGGTFLRVPGTFYDANHLPAYLLTGLPIILVLGWTVRRIIVRRLLLFLAGLLGFVVLLSFSRSGFAGIALSFAVIFIYAAWRGYWQKVAQLGSLVLVIGFIIFLSSRTQLSFANRLLSSFSGAEKSTVAHVALLYGEFKLFIDHPVLGVGYGSFSEYFRSSDIGKEHAIVDPATQVRIPPHSLWLEALTETGIIGFAFYLALMILILESLYKALLKARMKKSRLYLVALLAGFVGINFASIFYSYNLEFFWFFLIYAYLVSQHFLKDEEGAELIPPASEKEDLPWLDMAGFLFVAVFCGFFLFWRLGNGHIISETEGLNAYLAKWIQRRFEMGWPDFYVPKLFDNLWFLRTPLSYWLGSLMTLLYYVTTLSARFWPAFFGWLSCLLTFFIGNKLWGRRIGILAGIIPVAIPLFLSLSRAATLNTMYLAYFLGLTFIAFFLRTKTQFWLLAGVLQGLFFLTDQTVAWTTFLPLAAYGGYLILREIKKKTPKLDATRLLHYLLFFPLAFLPLAIWSRLMFLKFGRQFITDISFQPRWESLNTLLMLIYPLLALGLSYLVVVRFRRFLNRRLIIFTIVVIGVLAGVNFYQANRVSPDLDYLKLIAIRYQDNGNGVVPLLVDHPASWVLTYYSDIPLVWLKSSLAAEKNFLSDPQAFYAILKGQEFKKMKRALTGQNVGFLVLASENDLVLVKKW